MNFLYFKTFFEQNGYIALVIAVILVVAELLTEKFLADKLPNFIKNYAPVIIAILLAFVFDCLFVEKRITFKSSVIYSGLIAYSLSVMIKTVALKIAHGEKVEEVIPIAVIEQILDGIVSGGTKSTVATEIISEITSEYGGDFELLKARLTQIIKDGCLDEINENTVLESVSLIISLLNKEK